MDPYVLHLRGEDEYAMNSWFEGAAEEKNIELIWSNPLRDACFIATGITPSEFRIWLEMEMRVCDMVRKEKSGGEWLKHRNSSSILVLMILHIN